MSLSFKEYCAADQCRLICIVECLEQGLVPGLADALQALRHCAAVQLSGPNTIIVVSEKNYEANSFLAEVQDVVDAGPGPANILETRLGSIVDSLSAKIVLSDRFSVVSSPSQLGQGPGDTLYLEYGTVFGSGHHPSTRLAVRALEEICGDGEFPNTALDIGCGTGILSFVCNRLGAEKVVGIDICPNSIGLAMKNKGYNCPDDQVGFCCGTLSAIKARFDLIVANISPSVLHALIDDFPARLAPGAEIVLSGLHSGQMTDIIEAMSKSSCELLKSYGQESWRALRFRYCPLG